MSTALGLGCADTWFRRCAGHVVPEAFVGGPIALVEDGDKIVIDTEKRSIDWLVDEEEQARRRAKWQQREYPEKRGVLFRYARDVAVSIFLYCDSVAVGCVLILGTWWAACERWRVLRLKRLSMGVRVRVWVWQQQL